MTFNSIIRKTGSTLFTIGLLGCFLNLGVGYSRIAFTPDEKAKFDSLPVMGNQITPDSKLGMLGKHSPLDAESTVGTGLTGALLLALAGKKKQK